MINQIDSINNFLDSINVNDKEKVLKSAKSKGLIRNDEVYIGGVKFLLN